ncbi:hypothetical protein BC936DRAFT_145939 [Jimgerdemannia flammicorona]|uniref:Uncharacterized protein n=1 Tax=Jimgerdemannia flammicorona TaxID=994334 RepID=A0A433D8Q0_9FUNG|nr:hypothetical protein BC936DRAFT_145939 [Jimgerdemannia flammicorona]
MSEPRLMASKYLNYQCNREICDIDDFFKNVPASKWSLESYFNNLLKHPDYDLSFDQAFTIFTDSLEQLNQLASVPVSVRSVCKSVHVTAQTKGFQDILKPRGYVCIIPRYRLVSTLHGTKKLKKHLLGKDETGKPGIRRKHRISSNEDAVPDR